MEEILIRDELLNNVLRAGLAHGPAISLQPERLTVAKIEFAYLQLRMICELIAISCFVAHGDVAGTRTAKLWKRYEADAIMKELEKLHPDFYPKPSRQSQERDPRGFWRLAPRKSDFLTKEELLHLYGKCGRHLHRGSLRTVLALSTRPDEPATPIEWADKIWRLLEHHQIQTVDPNVQLIGLMKDKKMKRPQFSYWTRQSNGTWVCDGAVRAVGSAAHG